MPPTVPTRPAGGASIATNWGQWAHDWFKKRDIVRGSGNLTLGTAYADIPAMTMTLGAGWFMILGIIDASITVTGPGEVQVVLTVDGVDQAQPAIFQPASADFGECTFSQVWLVNIAGAGVVKLRARKLNAGGTATVIGTNSALAVI